MNTKFGRILVLTLFAVSSAAFGQYAASVGPSVPGVGPLVPTGGDCAGGEIYDDGSAENGYSGNPALVSLFQGVQQFTPASFPWNYDSVCVCFTTTAAGGPNLDLEIEVLDDDGPGGGPGTSLGAVPASIAGIPLFPGTSFYQFDISSLNLSIAAGNVWIGPRWNPMLFPSRFVCADESAGTPLHPGFVNFNTGSGWQATQTVFPAYRAKLVRALGGPVGADLSILKVGIENPVGTVVYTIDVTNNGPSDATNVVVTDTLPVELSYVSDDCGGSDLPPWTWNVGSLLNGATATCNITLSVVTPGPVINVASVVGDQADPEPNNDSSTATLVVQGAPDSPLAIPTLSAAGLAGLLVLLAGSALLLLRRRRA